MYIPVYYIGTGKTFVTVDKNGKAIATMNFPDAKLFKDKQKAGQFLVSLPRKLYNISTKWEIREYNTPNTDKLSKLPQKIEKPQPQVGTPKKDKTNINTAMPEVDYVTLLDTVSILKENKNGCLTNLNNKLSDISQEIIDLEHYIEFNKLNACEAYHAYKMLHDTLQKRRKIKDTITAAQSLYENCDVDKLSSCNEYLHNRTYNPRKLTSLFK